jgi:PLP dependent protein
LRFTVRRPPQGKVSLCWYRPSGGDVASRIHVGVAWSGFAGDAREDRLVLAVFGCDVPTNGASLRRVRGRNVFDTSRSFLVEPDDKLAPGLTTDRAVKPSFLHDAKPWLVQRAACGTSHRPHVELLHSDCVEPKREICCCLLDPIAPPIHFARFEFRDRQPDALSTVGATPGACEALLQPTQSNAFTSRQARNMQQLPGGKRRRYHHTAIDTDHTAVRRSWSRVWDMREGDMPAPGPVPSYAVGLHTSGQRSGPPESDSSDFGHPDPPVLVVQLLDVARLHSDLPKAFVHTGLAPRRTTVGAGEKVLHGLRKVSEGLLLHRLRSGSQPITLGADLGQLRRLQAVPRGAAARTPKLLLLYRQIPHEPCMPAMLQQHVFLSSCRQQPEPRHTRNVARATDISGLARARADRDSSPAYSPRFPARGVQMTTPRPERESELADALTALRSRLAAAAEAAARKVDEIQLLPITKFFPATDVAILSSLGCAAIGESREQEAAVKVGEVARLLGGTSPHWHMVGQIQRNKARSLANWAHTAHSISSLRVVQALDRAVAVALSERRRENPLQVYVQISLDGDVSRGGVDVSNAKAVDEICAQVEAAESLELVGLMGIPPLDWDPDTAFALLESEHQRVRRAHPAAAGLSAGMSNDLESAVKHGSTCVRVGTALLGRRPLPSP